MPANQRTSRLARTSEETTTRRHTSLTPKVAVARRGHHAVRPSAPVVERPAASPETPAVRTFGHISPKVAVAPRGVSSVEGLRTVGHALRAARRFAA